MRDIGERMAEQEATITSLRALLATATDEIEQLKTTIDEKWVEQIDALTKENKELKLERDQLKCWATTADEQVKKLEPELADYKRISLNQEKTMRELRMENEKLKEEVKTLDWKLNDTTAWKDHEKFLIDTAQTKIDTLIEANATLAARVSEWKEVAEEYTGHDDPWPSLMGEWICEQVDEWEADKEAVEADKEAVEEENEKLKSENKKLEAS